MTGIAELGRAPKLASVQATFSRHGQLPRQVPVHTHAHTHTQIDNSLGLKTRHLAGGIPSVQPRSLSPFPAKHPSAELVMALPQKTAGTSVLGRLLFVPGGRWQGSGAETQNTKTNPQRPR